jgi:hypothetical protein
LLSVNRLFIFSKASLWRGASMPETFSAKKNLGFLSLRILINSTKSLANKFTLQDCISDIQDSVLPAQEKQKTNGSKCLLPNHEYMIGGFSSMYTRNSVSHHFVALCHIIVMKNKIFWKGLNSCAFPNTQPSIQRLFPRYKYLNQLF